VPFEDGRQRVRPDLLLALDEDRHADRETPAVGPERGDVSHHTGLVVRDAAPEDPPVAFRGLERGAVPPGLVAGGLDVVVGVQGDRRGPLRAVDMPDDGGAAALADHCHVQSLGPQQHGDGLGALVHAPLVEGVE